ncbi:MAG TPA: hypothetical protein VJR29_07605 [bacterium]|nr:hypothetical protein [bacterium]
MAGTATATQGASAQTQQQPAESPEIVAARNKANEAGYARNRAELTYNTAKKEQGADSEAAKAALKTLEAAQAEVEKAQAELRDLLKLSKKAPAPAQVKKPAEAKAPAPAQPAPEKPAAGPGVPPKGAYFEVIQVQPKTYESIYRGEYFYRRIELDLKIDQQLKQLLQEIKKDPNKSLDYYLEQLKKNPKGEMLLKS